MGDLLVLTENTTTSRKEQQILDTLFQKANVSATFKLVDHFEDWRRHFIKANAAYDIIYIPTNGGIKGWYHDQAVEIVKNNLKVPVVTCEDFMMPYAVFGLTKVAKEQGIWAAETARRILAGERIKDIPVTRNQQSVTWINTQLSEIIQFHLDSTLLQKAQIAE